MPVYAYEWEDGWWKVGFAPDVLQRATDGWWAESHPRDLCGKLDVTSCRLRGVWDTTKAEEEGLHRHFAGGTLRRHAHNEFYRDDQWAAVEEYMERLPKLPIPEGPREVRYAKRRQVCCGGRALHCEACDLAIQKNWKRHTESASHKRNVRARGE
jgi:hypothetical protein